MVVAGNYCGLDLEFGHVLAVISSVPIFKTSGWVHVLEANDWIKVSLEHYLFVLHLVLVFMSGVHICWWRQRSCNEAWTGGKFTCWYKCCVQSNLNSTSITTTYIFWWRYAFLSICNSDVVFCCKLFYKTYQENDQCVLYCPCNCLLTWFSSLVPANDQDAWWCGEPSGHTWAVSWSRVSFASCQKNKTVRSRKYQKVL